MLPAKTLSISIARDWRELYDEIWRPQDFGKWAAGLARSVLVPDGDAWRAEGPAGEVRIRFSERNLHGVLDHTVETADGQEVFVPLRVVRNREGAEVMLTLFRQPGMSDADYTADRATIEADLARLKSLAEAGTLRQGAEIR